MNKRHFVKGRKKERMLIQYKNHNGGINNLVVVESEGITTTSLKDRVTAIKNHKRKLLRIKSKQTLRAN